MIQKRPPKLTLAVLRYAREAEDFTTTGVMANTRFRWDQQSVKSRVNKMVHLGLLTRLIEGSPALGIPSRFAITEAGEERLTQILCSSLDEVKH